MVQEIIPGGDDTLYGYLGMWDGEELRDAWLTKRKLRQNNPFGDGSLQVSIEAEDVADLSRRLLGRFNYRGFVGVEFRFDARDRTYRLMEINPRTVSGNQLAISAGIDFPWLGYRYLTKMEGGAVPSSRFVPGVKYVNEEWDLKAFLSRRQAGKLTFAEWVRSLRGVKAWAIGAADDPYPFLALLGRLLRAFLDDLLNFKSGRKKG
jgi:predicted ATP-grasp superfamily ATP-dependent carboligase